MQISTKNHLKTPGFFHFIYLVTHPREIQLYRAGHQQGGPSPLGLVLLQRDFLCHCCFLGLWIYVKHRETTLIVTVAMEIKMNKYPCLWNE